MQAKLSLPVVFSEELRKLMKLKGLTQQDLAQKFDVSQAAVSKWLNGTLPEPSMVERLGAFFGFTVELVLTGESPPRRSPLIQPLVLTKTGLRAATQETASVPVLADSPSLDSGEFVRLSEFLFKDWPFETYREFIGFALTALESESPGVRALFKVLAQLATREMGKRFVKNADQQRDQRAGKMAKKDGTE